MHYDHVVMHFRKTQLLEASAVPAMTAAAVSNGVTAAAMHGVRTVPNNVAYTRAVSNHARNTQNET
jgi:hypothetical protein